MNLLLHFASIAVVLLLLFDGLFVGAIVIPASSSSDGEAKKTLSAEKLKLDLDRVVRSSTPESSGLGHLMVYIKKASKLENTDLWINKPDPYVRVIVLHANQSSTTERTKTKKGTKNPTWNQLLDFGIGDFQSLQISVWDNDKGFTGDDDRMIDTQVFPVTPGNHTNLKLCEDSSCSAYMLFDYYFIKDGDECVSQPCQNGGICHDGIVSYTCSCTNGYAGPECQHNLCLDKPCLNGGTCTTLYFEASGTLSYQCTCPKDYTDVNCRLHYPRVHLEILARDGTNLPDRDGRNNHPDPYFKVQANRHLLESDTKKTNVDKNTINPEWDQMLDFGCSLWTDFTVQVYDHDPRSSDDRLTNEVEYTPTIGCHSDIKICGTKGCSGYVYFDYCFSYC